MGTATIRRAAGALSLAGFLAVAAARAPAPPPLRLLRTVPLTGVHGRLDHFDVDVLGHRLFLSALGNNTLEVFDRRSLRLLRTIPGLRAPQGVTYVPPSNRIFVASGGDGVVRIYDGSTYALVHSVRLPSDADDTRYDPASNRVWVGFGGRGRAGLAVLDGATGRLVETLALPAHPESFQLASAGPLVYVNLPSAGNVVAVLDRATRRRIATWTLGGARANFPMALDQRDNRLFIACRRPAEVLVLDAVTGRILARLPCVTSADDLWYDPANRRIYVSGGGGAITVIQQQTPHRYLRLAEFPTPPGGRTSLLLPGLHRLYLGVWGRAGRPEALQAYAVQP